MPDEHLNIPSVRSVKILAKQNGFKVCSLTRFGSGVTSGTAPKIIKNIADKLAKLFKFGDRAAFLLITIFNYFEPFKFINKYDNVRLWKIINVV